MTKNQRQVTYPMLFQVEAGITYSLRAVIPHRGNTPATGHYVAYARADDGAWHFHDDDASARAVQDHAELLEQQAYMLFYERC